MRSELVYESKGDELIDSECGGNFVVEYGAEWSFGADVWGGKEFGI